MMLKVPKLQEKPKLPPLSKPHDITVGDHVVFDWDGPCQGVVTDANSNWHFQVQTDQGIVGRDGRVEVKGQGVGRLEVPRKDCEKGWLLSTETGYSVVRTNPRLDETPIWDEFQRQMGEDYDRAIWAICALRNLLQKTDKVRYEQAVHAIRRADYEEAMKVILGIEENNLSSRD